MTREKMGDTVHDIIIMWHNFKSESETDTHGWGSTEQDGKVCEVTAGTRHL